MNRSFEKCERKGTKEHLVKGEVCGGEEQRCMNGLRESWRQTNRGQMEREELACDGSCPGLILSVCAGWQEGCTGKLNTHTHTHWYGEGAADRLGYPIRPLCLPIRPPRPPALKPPPPPSLLVYSCILNPSLTANAPTLSIPHIRHLLFHQQVVGLEKGRSHQGAGSCEGYWFMHRPDLLFPSIPTLFLLSAFPVFARGLLYFDIGMWRNKWNKERNLCGWDKEMPKGM